MRFFRLLSFDFRQGTLKNLPYMLCLLILPVLFCLDWTIQLNALGATSEELSFADYFFYIYGGMDEYIPDVSTPFYFPTIWMILHLAPMLCLATYPFRDLQTFGIQVLYRAKSRILWWLSKCVWNIFTSFLYHGLFLLVIALFCMLRGIPLSSAPNLELLRFSLNLDSNIVLEVPVKITPWIVISIILVSMSMNLFQMTLSLHMKPSVSVLVLTAIMIISAYFLTPWLIGNYAMAGRLVLIAGNWVPPQAGIIISISLTVLAAIYGAVQFYFYDNLAKE